MKLVMEEKVPLHFYLQKHFFFNDTVNCFGLNKICQKLPYKQL